MSIAGLCTFESQPGPVEGLLGEPLNIPCVFTEKPQSSVLWSRQQPSTGWHVIGDSVSGVYDAYKHLYVMKGRGPRDFTLEIKSLGLDGSKFACKIAGTASEESDITVIGRRCISF